MIPYLHFYSLWHNRFSPSNVQSISHLLFADDMLVFSNGRLKSFRCLRGLLHSYERSSGQQINLEKSSVYVSKSITGRKLSRIQHLLGCQVKEFPFTYLGAPLYRGRCKEVYFERIFQIVTSKLEGWKAKILSFAGKITLIKSVLASIPIHTLSCSSLLWRHTCTLIFNIFKRWADGLLEEDRFHFGSRIGWGIFWTIPTLTSQLGRG